jgi:hypothetical protein
MTGAIIVQRNIIVYHTVVAAGIGPVTIWSLYTLRARKL